MSGLLCGPLMLSGQTYFQQQVDHTIDVRLDDERHVLHGHSDVDYTNNSPNTLDTLWIHLWPNAYRDRSSALCKQLDRTGELDLHFATEEERGWIDSLDFRTNDTALKWGYHPEHADIAWVVMDTPLSPGASTRLSTLFA
ncbi:MAG: hypothetical protein R2818_06635 [Flavobacteriales bacterium]